MLEQEWEMPCLWLPIVKEKNNPISSRAGVGMSPKRTLLWHGGLGAAHAGAGPRGWHSTAWHAWARSLCRWAPRLLFPVLFYFLFS